MCCTLIDRNVVTGTQRGMSPWERWKSLVYPCYTVAFDGFNRRRDLDGVDPRSKACITAIRGYIGDIHVL